MVEIHLQCDLCKLNKNRIAKRYSQCEPLNDTQKMSLDQIMTKPFCIQPNRPIHIRNAKLNFFGRTVPVERGSGV